jgi:hypothetical protein
MPSLVLAKKCYGVAALFNKIIAGDNRASYGKTLVDVRFQREAEMPWVCIRHRSRNQ